MNFIYQTVIFFYSLFLKIASLFNKKAAQFVKGRQNWYNNLAAKVDAGSRYIWFHCASLGEFEQGRPLIEKIKKQFPEFRILLTFFSPSGYEIRKNYELADIVAYLPLDTRRNARKFISLVQPEKAFFIKYEYWYFFMDELKKRGVPLYIVSAIFRENQQFFKKSFLGSWYRKILLKADHFFVQNENSARLLESIGHRNFTVSGDTRFDRVAALAKNVKNIPVVEKFKKDAPVLIAGSTWKPDEELLTEFINNHSEMKLIIAPHEVTESNINRIGQLLKKPHVRLSRADEKNVHQCQVLIVDSVGLLSSLYRYGTLAYLGGGFGVGIHNILEAATFGLPVIFGPNYKKFKEAVDLINRGGAFSIQNYSELENILLKMYGNSEQRLASGATSRKYVRKNIGSTELIIQKVFND